LAKGGREGFYKDFQTAKVLQTIFDLSGDWNLVIGYYLVIWVWLLMIELWSCLL